MYAPRCRSIESDSRPLPCCYTARDLILVSLLPIHNNACEPRCKSRLGALASQESKRSCHLPVAQSCLPICTVPRVSALSSRLVNYSLALMSKSASSAPTCRHPLPIHQLSSSKAFAKEKLTQIPLALYRYAYLCAKYTAPRTTDRRPLM